MTEEELQQRAAIVQEAISYEMTPYHDHGRVKGVGVDCAMLPALIYEAVGVVPEIIPEYASDWMNHRDEELYLAEIRKWAKEIEVEAVLPGDLVVWKFGRVYSHSAIVIDPPIVIHAVKRIGFVVRANMNEEEDLVNRPRKAFSVFA